MLGTTRLRAAIPVVLALGCALPRGAGAEAAAVPPDEAPQVLARGDGFVITLDDFRARMAEQSEQVRARFATPEKRREFLDNLIRFEVLAVEARRQGLERDPEVALTTKKVMVKRLVQVRFDGPGDKAEKTKAFDAYLASLREKSRVEVTAAALDTLAIEPAPAAAPQPAAK